MAGEVAGTMPGNPAGAGAAVVPVGVCISDWTLVDMAEACCIMPCACPIH